MFGNIFRVIAKLLGTRIHGKLIVTNLRALEIRETINWYCFPTRTEVKLLTKSSIKEVGYTMEKVCLVFVQLFHCIMKDIHRLLLLLLKMDLTKNVRFVSQIL